LKRGRRAATFLVKDTTPMATRQDVATACPEREEDAQQARLARLGLSSPPVLSASRADAARGAYGIVAERLSGGKPDTRGKDWWMDWLDAVGVDNVLERIASGMLPVEIAFCNGVPLMVMNEWLRTRVPPDRLTEAWSVHAEVLLLRAQLGITQDADTPGEAQLIKAECDRFAWMAERLDSRRWGPPGKAAEKPPLVAIELNIAGAAGGAQVFHTVDASAVEVTAPPAAPSQAPDGGALPDVVDLSGMAPHAPRDADLDAAFRVIFGAEPRPREMLPSS
jgi:hypothetical protein